MPKTNITAMRQIPPPTWKSSFSPILAEDELSPPHLKMARSRSILESEDIASLGTPDSGPSLSASPTSIDAVAPPPSPGRRQLRIDTGTQETKRPARDKWTSFAREESVFQRRSAKPDAGTSLERRLFQLPMQSATTGLRRCVVVQGKSVLWTGKLHETTGLPTGSGKMFFSDGQLYEGNCRHGLRHGPGHNTWPNQQVFIGEWHDGCRARGTHTWPDGRTCTGRWSDGHVHGRVSMDWPNDGARFAGWTVRGRQHGHGEHTWGNGRVYKGEYWKGRQHGEGTLTEPDGVTVYKGEFREGKRHGQGTQVWVSKTYEGEWRQNCIHGRGTLKWNFSNQVYTGQFANGRFHGHGSFRDDVEGYIGQWVDGVQEGVGKQYFVDGTVYEGGFVKGRRQGFGCLALPDGSVYSGSFVDGQRSGRGIEIAGNGDLFHCGYWKDDQPDYTNPAIDLDTISEGDSSESSSSTAETSLFSRPSEFESIFWG